MGTGSWTRDYDLWGVFIQDLTGRRIPRLRVLKIIEERVDRLVTAFDPQVLAAAREHASSETVQQAGNKGRTRVKALGDQEEDDALLNGPQLGDNAMQQDDIDSLISGSSTSPKSLV